MVNRKMDPELAGDPPPEAGDDVELVVLDVKAHDPGFYMNRTRTYFVAQDGSVYLVRAPGQPVTLQREDDLPADCDLSLVDDLALLHLGVAANLAGRRLGGALRCPRVEFLRDPPTRRRRGSNTVRCFRAPGA